MPVNQKGLIDEPLYNRILKQFIFSRSALHYRTLDPSLSCLLSETILFPFHRTILYEQFVQIDVILALECWANLCGKTWMYLRNPSLAQDLIGILFIDVYVDLRIREISQLACCRVWLDWKEDNNSPPPEQSTQPVPGFADCLFQCHKISRTN